MRLVRLGEPAFNEELLGAVPAEMLAITEPLATSRAANRLVVPSRVRCWVVGMPGEGRRGPIQRLDLGLTVYISADNACLDGVRAIADRYGPVDL